jgi:hypothetical protein
MATKQPDNLFNHQQNSGAMRKQVSRSGAGDAWRLD